MINSWTKEQIQALKRDACARRDDALIDEELIKLNLHLSNYDKATLITTKNAEWKVIEEIALELSSRLHARAVSN